MEEQLKTMALPRFMVLKSTFNNKYLEFVHEDGEVHAHLRFSADDILSPFVKFEVEVAEIGGGFVNLRSCYNNRYWVRQHGGLIVGTGDQPDEDLSKSSCTLFRPISVNGGGRNDTVRFRHVQSESYAFLWTQSPFHVWDPRDLCMSAGDNLAPDSRDVFTIIDWESLVVLPQYVAFRGYNDAYLKARWIERHEYLEFSSDDKGEAAVGFEVFPTNDGRVRIKSNLFTKFWRRSPNWIWADANDTNYNLDTLFWPVKIGNNAIALRNSGNNMFCQSLTTEGKRDCLNASASTISRRAELKVEELVISREIYNVRFRLNDARIYGLNAFVAATSSAINRTMEDNTLDFKLAYTNSKSYTFRTSVSVKGGAKTTFKTGLPFIAEGKIEVSFEVQGSWEWGETNTETTQVETVYKARVPAMSKVTINVVALRGSCDVPFSYTQRDTLYNGKHVITEMHDGIYTGVNYFDFNYESKIEGVIRSAVDEEIEKIDGVDDHELASLEKPHLSELDGGPVQED